MWPRIFPTTTLVRAAAAAAALVLAGCDGAAHLADLSDRARAGDEAAAIELRQQALRDARAAFFTGLRLDPAIGAKGTSVEAARWYLIALRHSPGARHNLALMLLRGVPVDPRDPALPATEPRWLDRITGNASLPPPPALDPVQLLEQAGEDRRAESMLLLAELLERGHPAVEVNATRAAQWFRRAIEWSNDPRAIARLGAMTYDGRGVEQDRELGRAMLQRAAGRGVLEAAVRLGEIAPTAFERTRWLLIADAMKQQQAISTDVLRLLDGLTADERDRVLRDVSLWLSAHRAPARLKEASGPVDRP